MIVLDLSDKRPIYEQIRDKYKELISLGALEKDEQMPSVRSLAVDLSINPNTIQRAYAELEREGFLYVVKGRGNFVADISQIRKKRQDDYYYRLDELLGKAESYSLVGKEIIAHTKEYFEKKKGADNND